MKLDRSTPPKISDFSLLNIPECETIFFGDSLDINIIRTGNAPVNSLSLIWDQGKRDMPLSYAPKLLPVMMMQGSRSRDAQQITDEIDFLGAFVSNQVSTSYTTIDTLSLNEFTPDLLNIISDFVLHPTFPDERFQALIRKAVANLKILLTKTSYVADKTLAEKIRGEAHPYCRNYSVAEIEKTSLSQVKASWQNLLKKSPLHIFAAGQISSDLLSVIKDFASGLVCDDFTRAEKQNDPWHSEKPGIYHVDMPMAKQSSIAMAYPTINRTHSDYIPLRIAVTALGGYFGSRLMTNIREEKGLTYGISASLAASRQGATINIEADCDSSYCNSVIQEINKEMEKMSATRMSDSEFRRLRSFYMTTIASTLESFKGIGDYYKTTLTLGVPKDYFYQQQNIINNITPEDIRNIAQKYFDPKLFRTVIAGPLNH